MPPLIREMLENPEAFEDSSDSGDSTAATPPAAKPIKQEEKPECDSAEGQEVEGKWDEEKKRVVDSDRELGGQAAAAATTQKKGVTGKAQ